MRILLDTSPLSQLAHPRHSREIHAWALAHMDKGNDIHIPEPADYEVRRELLRLGNTFSLNRLDKLHTLYTYLPITTPVMRRAAEMWAHARRMGRPTAHPHALDVDIIIAAQAETIGAVVATENAKHLSLFVDARSWAELV